MSEAPKLLDRTTVKGTLAIGAAALAFGGGAVAGQSHGNPDHHVARDPANTLVLPEVPAPTNFQEFLDRQPGQHSKRHGHTQNAQPENAPATATEPTQSTPKPVETHHTAKPHTSTKQTEASTEIVSAFGNVPEMPQPIIDPGELPEDLTPPEELKHFDFSNSITPEESQTMREYTTYLGGCSGFLIKAEDGTPIGVRDAAHCNFLLKDGHWSKDASGSTILNFGAPILAQTGDDLLHLTTVGKVKEMVLPAPDDLRIDEVIGAFGHNTEQVLERAQETQMSEDEVEAIEPGTRLINSGFPQDQETNGGPLRRQESSTTVVGLDEMNLLSGQTVKLLITGITRNANKAGCSPGNSGSSLFKRNEDGTPTHVGTATAYVDLEKASSKDREYYEQRYGVSLEGVNFLCGWSYQLPKLDEGAVVAKVVTPEAPTFDVVGDIEKAKAAFNDPGYDKSILEGLVLLPYGKEGKWVRNAFVFPNADGSVVILHSETKSGEPVADFLSTADQLEMYSEKDDDSLPIHHSQGEAVAVGDNGQWIVHDHDQNGNTTEFTFGTLVDSPLKPGQRYTGRIDESGKLVPVPVTRDYTPGPKG
jgi:hypothetical protein